MVAVPTAPRGPTRARRRAALVAVGANLGLLGLKGAAALLTGSLALLATAADSLIDLAAAVIAYLGVRLGGMPPDDTHAYGHDKIESLSALAQLGILFVTVGLILAEAWDRLRDPAAIEAPLVGVPVMLVSMAVAWWLARRLRRVSDETGGSQALEADALHLSADVWAHGGVVVGLLAVRLGHPLADPVVAFGVAVWIGLTSVPMIRETANVLLDRAPDEATVHRLHSAIQSVPQVVDHHTLRARLVGNRLFLDVVVELEPDLSFRRAHDLSHELQEALREAVPSVADAVIHVEPADHPPHQDRHHSHGFDALSYGRSRPRPGGEPSS